MRNASVISASVERRNSQSLLSLERIDSRREQQSGDVDMPNDNISVDVDPRKRSPLLSRMPAGALPRDPVLDTHRGGWKTSREFKVKDVPPSVQHKFDFELTPKRERENGEGIEQQQQLDEDSLLRLIIFKVTYFVASSPIFYRNTSLLLSYQCV